MIEIAEVIIEGIKQMFQDNYLDLVIYLTILLLTFWLYKEFRKNLLESEKERKEKVSSLLIVLTDLEFELDEYKREKSDFSVLKEKLVNATPFLSYDLNKMVSSINPDMDDATIDDFVQKLEEEKNGYKYIQNDSISHVNEKSIIRIIEYHYKTKFEPIINPLIMTVLTMLLILLFLLVTISISLIDSFIQKANSIFIIVNSIIFLVFLLGILDTILNKRFVNKWYTWLLISIMFVLSLVSLVLAYQYFIWSIVCSLLFIILIFTVLPKVIKRGK